MTARNGHASSSSSPEPIAGVTALLGTLFALGIIASSAVSVALPEVARDLRLDTAGAAWVLGSFALCFSTTTVLFGRATDIYGLRLPLRVGAVLLTVGSLLAATAWSFPSLIVGRSLQGLGAGAIPVTILAIVSVRFTGQQRTKVFGGLTGAMSVVSATGPLIGGVLAEFLTWRAVVALPVVAIVITEPVVRLAPASSLRSRGLDGLDLTGALFVVSVSVSVSMVLQSPATDLRPLLIGGFGLVAAAGAMAAVRHVRIRPDGFLPRAVLSDPIFARCALAGLTPLTAYFGLLVAVPLMLSESQGWSPMQIGTALLPAAAFGGGASRWAGRLIARFEPLSVATALLVACSLGLLLAGLGSSSPSLIVLGMAFTAAGWAGAQITFVDAISNIFDESLRGAALGVFMSIFYMGSVLGASFIGGLADLVSLPGAVSLLALIPMAGAVVLMTRHR